MAENRVSVEAVVAFEEPSGGDAVVRLADGSTCLASREDPRFGFWSGLIKQKQGTGQRVYFECHAGTGQVRTILPTLLRKVDALKAPVGDRHDVALFMQPSLHFLRTTGPHYAEWRRALEEAQASKQPLLLVTEPKTLEILDVRQPDPAPPGR